ncbi:MAG: hypothetical protein KG028_14625 [Actinobacteria bacterium]|jgi:hypothetical protein|nr:hypothetical protein [Actinomycetota bacterium]
MPSVADPTRGSRADHDPLVRALQDRLGDRVRPGAPLAALTTLRVGGPARALVVAENDRDLATVGELCRVHPAPWAVIGRGSNLLVADAGWPGVAIRLGRGFRGVEHRGGPVRPSRCPSSPPAWPMSDSPGSPGPRPCRAPSGEPSA